MVDPRELFLQRGSKASLPLQSLMKLMGLEPVDDFATVAQRIAEAQWSRLPAEASPERKEELQAHLPEFRPYLHALGVLRPFPDAKGEVRLRASEVVWPGASARQAAERLRPLTTAVAEGRASNLVRLTALAAVSRKPVGNELEYLGDLVADPRNCIKDGQVLEGEMMRWLWERARVDYGGLLRYVKFTVVTTASVPPEALHGRPTGLATLAAWWHLNPNPRRVCIASIAPYGYRFWCEALQNFPSCAWELLAPVPDEPNVVGALSEVGKIVYNLAK